MQKRTQQTPLPRSKDFRAYEALNRRSMHRRIAIAVTGAVLLLGVRILTPMTAEPRPGESP